MFAIIFINNFQHSSVIRRPPTSAPPGRPSLALSAFLFIIKSVSSFKSRLCTPINSHKIRLSPFSARYIVATEGVGGSNENRLDFVAGSVIHRRRRRPSLIGGYSQLSRSSAVVPCDPRIYVSIVVAVGAIVQTFTVSKVRF